MAVTMKPCGTRGLVIAAALLSAIESVLVWAGALQPVLSYSLGNIIFALSRVALAAYAGTLVVGNGIKQSALAGAKVMFSGSLVFCVAVLAGRLLALPTVLGASASGMVGLAILIASVLVGNTALGAIIGALAGWAALKSRKRASRPVHL